MLERYNETEQIIQAAIEVHKQLGFGFVEQVYQEALEIEFSQNNIPYEREKHLVINYKGIQLKKDFYADFVCFGDIIVELKAVSELQPEFTLQVLNYMKIMDSHIALLLNFGKSRIEIKRVVRDDI